MKPIIMEMREMNLSKEVYDKKPGLFFSIFIYGLLALVITALVWAYFGRLDIVVRAQGMIRPNAQMAMVINAVGGEVRGVFFYEGQRVSQGDILYMIDTFHLENERRLIAERLGNLNFEQETLELFRDSLESGENLINSFNEEFSTRFDTFMVNLNATQHGASNQLDLLQESERGLEDSLSNARFERDMLRIFENSILQGEDLFGDSQANSGRNREVFTALRNQYLRYELEMENLRFQIQSARTTLEGYGMIRNSVYHNKNFFPNFEFSIYKSMYEEYLLQLDQLLESYALAEENYISYTTLYYAGAVSRMELQSASNRAENARTAVAEFNSSFLLSIDSSIRNTENRLAQLENQAEILHVSTLTDISTQVLNLEADMVNMSQSITQFRLQRESMFFVGYEIGDAVMLRLGEINRTLGQISAIEQEITRLELNMERIEAQINDSTVRAPIDGEVSVHTELTEGGFVPGGVQVISIIPTRQDMLSANIFVSNNDIGQISEGMVVRYDIAALPRRDFGEITGTIIRISTDIATDYGIQGFFIVESEIEDRMYYDTRGNGVELRVGMGFEARMIVEQQRILFYLLDRLNLLINR